MTRGLKIGGLLSVIPLALLVLGTVKLPNHNYFWREMNNSGHAPLFGTVALAFLFLSFQLLSHRFENRWLHYALAFVLAAGVGLATELYQVIGPRDADLYDGLLDIIGAASFLLVAAAFDRRLRKPPQQSGRRIHRLFLLGGILLFLSAFIAPGLWGAAMISRQASFPLICGFETYLQTKWFQPVRVDLEVVPPPLEFTKAEGEYVGKFISDGRRFPKITIHEVYPDWRGYDYFEFDIYSTHSSQIHMAIRLEDAHHFNRFTDRFNRRLMVQPGYNHFQFSLDEIQYAPSTRDMDLSAMTQMVIFGVEPVEPYVVYIDNIRVR